MRLFFSGKGATDIPRRYSHAQRLLGEAVSTKERGNHGQRQRDAQGLQTSTNIGLSRNRGVGASCFAFCPKAKSTASVVRVMEVMR